MFACPECSRRVFSAWRKLNASSLFPARCPACGTLSFVSGWAHAFSTLGIETAFWGSVLLALTLHSWFAFVLLPVAVLIVSTVVAAAFPFKPIPRSVVVSARRSALVQSALGVVVLVLGIVVLGNTASK